MLFSIVLPYFKCEKYINRCINSVLKQTYKKWELIIIDDENSYTSKKILNSLKSKKIKIISNSNNLGVAASRNLGLKKTRGSYCAFLDSDDYWHKDKLKYQVNFFKKNKKAKICYTSYSGVHNSKFIYKVLAKKKITRSDLYKECNICCSSVVIHKSVYKNLIFNEHLITKEDYAYWLSVSKKNNFYGLKKILTYYTVRKNSLSSKHLIKIYNAFLIYYKINKLSFFRSIFFICRLYFNAYKKKFL